MIQAFDCDCLIVEDMTGDHIKFSHLDDSVARFNEEYGTDYSCFFLVYEGRDYPSKLYGSYSAYLFDTVHLVDGNM